MLSLLFIGLVVFPVILYPLLIVGWAKNKDFQGNHSNGNSDLQCTVVLVVRDEERLVGRRIRNLIRQKDQNRIVQIIVVDDCSSDRTVQTIKKWQERDDRIRVIQQPCQGKAAGVNRAVQSANTEWLAFCDVRQVFRADAMSMLLDHCSSTSAAIVGGSIARKGEQSTQRKANIIERYWKLERRLRLAESRLKMLPAVSGAFYAAKRQEMPRLPDGLILDDVYVPMFVAMNGGYSEMCSDAIAWESSSTDEVAEYRRRRRTLAGNFQLIKICPQFLRFWSSRTAFAFFVHKFLRALVPVSVAVISSFLFVVILGIVTAVITGGLLIFLVHMLAKQARRKLRTGASASLSSAEVALLIVIDAYCDAVRGQYDGLWKAHNREPCDSG